MSQDKTSVPAPGIKQENTLGPYVCSCQYLCGGIPREVARSTWYNHRQYRERDAGAAKRRARVHEHGSGAAHKPQGVVPEGALHQWRVKMSSPIRVPERKDAVVELKSRERNNHLVGASKTMLPPSMSGTQPTQGEPSQNKEYEKESSKNKPEATQERHPHQPSTGNGEAETNLVCLEAVERLREVIISQATHGQLVAAGNKAYMGLLTMLNESYERERREEAARRSSLNEDGEMIASMEGMLKQIVSNINDDAAFIGHMLAEALDLVNAAKSRMKSSPSRQTMHL